MEEATEATEAIKARLEIVLTADGMTIAVVTDARLWNNVLYAAIHGPQDVCHCPAVQPVAPNNQGNRRA